MQANRLFPVTLLLGITLSGWSSYGDVILWTNPAGGDFQTAANWTPSTVPAPTDVAVFDLDSLLGYTVSFTGPTTVDGLSIDTDRVILDLNGFTLSAVGPNSAAFEILIGSGAGRVGYLTVTDGTLQGGFYIAEGIGSEGHLTVSGANAVVDATSSFMCLGCFQGTASLTIEAGGTVNAPMAFDGFGVTNTITVTGAGSSLDVAGGNLGVGGNGSATLLIADGATVSNNEGYVGQEPGADGAVEVVGLGSSWVNSSWLIVGRAGTGSLAIRSGGSVANTHTRIGEFSGATGAVVVEDPGSTWTLSEWLRVGDGGEGTLDILNGGTVDVAFEGIIGVVPDGVGVATVSGTGSEWATGSETFVGYSGQGTLEILNGGHVTTNGFAKIASLADSTGSVLVSGAGSAWTIQHALNIAEPVGTGHLTISGGGVVQSLNLSFWGNPIGGQDTGTVLVTGAGSRWEMGSVLHLGRGTLSVESGGVVQSDAWADVGTIPGVPVSVQITGPGSQWIHASDVKIGTFPGCIATVEVSNGAVIQTLAVPVNTESVLEGDGLVDVEFLVVCDGRIRPGLSAGILTIDGDYGNTPSGTLEIDIGGLALGTQHDQLAVTGAADLAGKLDIALINSFAPSAGDSFDILTYGSRNGQFDNVIGVSPGPGLRWALDYNPTVLTLLACDETDPACDDCNLNGVLDGEDIADLTSTDFDFNGVPDECAPFIDGCAPVRDWSCFDNWDIPGDLYPDDIASAPGIFATLNAADDVLLDVDVAIPGLRILDQSTLHVAQSGTGNLTINTDRGLTVEGALLSANDRIIDVPFGAAKIAPNGTYAEDGAGDGSGCTPSVAGYACSSLSAGRIEIVRGHCESPVAAGGALDLTDSMSISVSGDLVIRGPTSPDCLAVTAGITPPPRLGVRDFSYGAIAGACLMTGAVDVMIDTDQAIELGGNWDNQATFPSRFHWDRGTLTMAGDGTFFEVAGVNLGPTTEGYLTDVDTFRDTATHQNFSMDSLEVAPGATITFANYFPNTAGGGCTEALYVHDLALRAGATVTIDNCKVYYGALTNEGVTPTLLGCGELLPDVPPPAPIPPPEGQGSRTLALSLPGSAAGPGQAVALRVRLMDLQNPNPPNLECCPPPDFTLFEAPTCFAAGEGGGCNRWVGPPATFLEAQDTPALGAMRAARLQCTPYYHDWTSEGSFHIAGAEVIPSSGYEVQSYGAACQGREDICGSVSAPVTVETRRAGDISSPYAPVAPGQPNAIDVANAVNHFKRLAGAPSKIAAQVQPNVPDLNADLNALDIAAVVDNLKGFAYPYSGPCVCPSEVPCGVTACTNASGCTGLYGAGATCVKTCIAGPNLGQPCGGNLHCGQCADGPRAGYPCDGDEDCAGSTCTPGTCGSAFCRDRCGRCN